jgi:PhoPQ-activated pathogenicity-related protein
MLLVKAVVRTMSAIEKYVTEKLNLPKPSNFIISGESKRGWVAWIVGAVDRRVAGIVPIVYDLAKIREVCYAN